MSTFLFRSALWLSVLLLCINSVRADEPAPWEADWNEIEQAARGQEVWFHAWGGSDVINRYLDWVSDEVQARFGIRLNHVRVNDIAESIALLQTVKPSEQGDIDMLWINGENFATLKQQGLLWGAFAEALPNAAALPPEGAWQQDFSTPVDGLEAPWGQARLVFIHDSERLDKAPASAAALLAFVQAGGRFLYPAPPSFHGTTVLKQWLLELIEDTDALYQPVQDSDFDALSAPLWDYLDQLHPHLVGQGERWPDSAEATLQALDRGEVDIALSFNPNEAANAVRAGRLAESVRTSAYAEGTIGNTHYLSIPASARAPLAAMVVIDFLLSPKAQARKADPDHWGDPSVLDITRLDAAGQAVFSAIDTAPWALSPDSSPMRAEPHASWTDALEQEWLRRYGH